MHTPKLSQETALSYICLRFKNPPFVWRKHDIYCREYIWYLSWWSWFWVLVFELFYKKGKGLAAAGFFYRRTNLLCSVHAFGVMRKFASLRTCERLLFESRDASFSTKLCFYKPSESIDPTHAFIRNSSV